jgi:hypothetical protein
MKWYFLFTMAFAQKIPNNTEFPRAWGKKLKKIFFQKNTVVINQTKGIMLI